MEDEREKNLPKWAQEMIRGMRLRFRSGTESMASELARLRPRVQLLENRLAATEELLTCAAMGGHKTAAEIMEVLRGYSLSLAKDE
jgi:hypothetical protein